jgi:parallel beta-helix repeat protein
MSGGNMKILKIIKKMSLALLVIGCFAFIVPQVKALTIKVKCDKGQSVQSALDSLTGPATIEVTGTCFENVVIIKDDVTLQGGVFVGTDPFRLFGARRVLISKVTVQGDKDGIVAEQGGSLTIKNSIIQHNEKNGIVANFGALVIVDECTIADNAGDGILASANSFLQLTSSRITDNGGAGVNVYEGSSAGIGVNFQGESKPNIIQNNGVNGVKVFQASRALIANNTIQNNAGYGVFVFGSSTRITNNIIKSNLGGITINNGGSARIGMTNDGAADIGNSIESNQNEGIDISNGAVAQMMNNTIRENGLVTTKAGIAINRATGHLRGDNIIEGNGSHGVQLTQGVLFQGGPTPGPDRIRYNHASGIFAWNASSLEILNAMVTNNSEDGIVLSLRSTLRIYGSTLSNNRHGIAVYDGSAAAFYYPTGLAPALITSHSIGIDCNGNEDSITGDLSGVTENIINVSSTCSGF